MRPERRSVCFGHLLLLIRARGSHRKLLLNNNYIRVALKLPADVNGGPARLIRFSLPQYLMRHRSSVSLTEKYEFQNVPDRVAFSPSEIDVRNLPSHVTRVQQEGGDRVGHGGTPRSQNPILSDPHASHSQDARKVRNVARPHLKEEHGVIGGNVIVPPLLFLFQPIFVHVTSVRTIGDDPNRAHLRFLDELARSVVQFDPFDTQFCRTQGARNERNDNDEDNEGRRNLYALWLFGDVEDRRVTENNRNRQVNPPPPLTAPLGDRHGDGGGKYQSQHAGRVSAALRVDVSVEENRHGKANGRQNHR